MTKKSEAKERRRFARGSGNVFADLGLPDADELLAKARLAEAIDDAISRLALTQTEAARRLGVDQGTVSKLVNGRLDGFSQERLIRYLMALGESVEIVVGSGPIHAAVGRLTVRKA
jgi:predicted XRE-type DNA-binding protein